MTGDWTLERLLWDDPDLESVADNGRTAACFPHSGVVTMRSGWDADATYVGLKSGRSVANHSHLDANSFVVSARGQRLLIDEGLWEYTITDYWDTSGPRFDFDSNATIGHNTLLVDGQGQLHGPGFGGKITAFDPGPQIYVAAADAAAAYGGRLDRYVRTIAFVKPETLLVFDQVKADQPRYFEWLFHFAGEVGGDETLTTFSQNGVTLSLMRVLPEEAECWRMSDVTRTSVYRSGNTLQTERPQIRYRSYGPFHPCEEVDVLWAIHVGRPDEMPVIEATNETSQVAVTLEFAEGVIKKIALDRTV